jgi:hypothetical protein
MIAPSVTTLQTHLGAAIARQCVVPESLVRTLNWLLVMAVVAMSCCYSCDAEKCAGHLHFGNMRKRRKRWESNVS